MDKLTRGNDNTFRLRFWQKTPQGKNAVDLTLMRNMEVVVRDFWGKVVESDWELDAEENNAMLLFISYINKASCHHTIEVTCENINDGKHHRFAKKCAFGTVDWSNDAYVTFEHYGEEGYADLDIDFEVVMTAITSDRTLVTQLQDMLDTATEQEAERQAAEGQRQQTFEDNEANRQATFEASEAARAEQFEGDEDVWDRKIQEKLDEIITMEFDAVPKNASNKAVKSNGIFDTFAELNEALSTEVTGYTVYNYNLQDTGRFGTSTSYHHAAIPVSAGEQYLIKRTGSNVIRYAYCTTNTYSSGAFIPMVSGTDVMRLNNDGDEEVATIPNGCTYLMFNAGSPYQVNIWKYRDKVHKAETAVQSQRPIQVNGTQVLGNNDTPLNLKAGENVTLTNSGGEVTISSTGGGASTWDDIQGKPNFATVATSGSYSDLSNKPTIPDVTGKADKVASATNGHLAGLNASGNLTDSGIVPSTLVYQGQSQGTVPSVDFDPEADTVHVTEQTLSSSQKAQARTNIGAQETLVSGTNIKTINNTSLLGNGNITIEGGSGTQIQSDWNQSDSEAVDYIKNKPTIPVVTGKADKVTGATNGNFAGLDTNGNLTDSGHKHSDYQKAALVIEIHSSDTTVPSGTYSSIGQALNDGKEVYVKLINSIVKSANSTIYCIPLITDNTNNQHDSYDFGSTAMFVSISSNDTISIDSVEYAQTSDIPTNVSDLYNDSGYTTNTGTITSVKMNGSTVASSGEVDLGTVITSHQDISGKADKVTSATNGNFAALDSNGNLTDSGHKHSDYITSHQDITGKADKVTSATNGNFAGLDSNGNLTDSGHKHSDYQTALSTQTAYTSKGSATKVPQITTNTLGQVTGITEVTITQPDISNCVQKSNTAGLLKNDGSVDTSAYLTSAPVTSVNNQTGAVTLALGETNVIEAVTFNGVAASISSKTAAITATIPDVSTKADKVVVVNASTLPASLDPNKVYQFGTLTGTVTIPAFASVAAGDTEAKIWCMTFSTSSTAPTITWPAAITAWSGGSTPTINASKSYEVSVMDGIGVIIEA